VLPNQRVCRLAAIESRYPILISGASATAAPGKCVDPGRLRAAHV